ncbi:MAG: sigma-70 family RNA polymerase sigma factor [Gemmatimonadetes bacterium]|nr:sigma-70 family RNA polymerase sigma factor [Gemmatimonadota bacterium]NIR80366.1 sigma-70 family RNA polymerase sigma factor [Gemmatimonadota bacterium]NIT89129.1 sigma-70 family RNA polymerase sigma factor [Gemmatimonadota bacterium]NIU32926.1 sigma-70 family RNA polymerase sigma factor [Gemmatimonadota bacterium]NIU37325.1 sigma-70 family RNA polymerase sigma factor [Gemmatimonadota bacterium]
MALSVTKSHEDAEDAAQEAFVVALERLDDCRSPEKFGGWLLTIVRNRARNLLRRETIRATEPVPESASTGRPGPDREAERSELRSHLRGAIGELPEVQRVVVMLHDLEGWKHREIADHLGLPAGTVRSHLHHARKGLRRLLGAALEKSSETSV